MEADVRLPVHEGIQLTAPEYRNHLYQVLGTTPPQASPAVTDPQYPSRPRCAPLPQMILERRGNSVPREKRPGGAPPAAGPSAPLPQAHPPKPRAAPQLPSGWTARDPGHRTQNSPGHDPANGV